MKVLIIKYGALGDIILATPAIRRIREHHAGDDVTLLTSPAYASLFEDTGLDVRAFPRRGLRATLETLCWVRRQGFRRLIDLQSNDRSGLLCALSGVPERIGNHPRFPYHLHPPDRYHGQCHIHERMNQVLAAGGIALPDGPPALPAPARIRQKVRDWLHEQSLEAEAFVLLHAGSSPRHPQKRWPGFGELAAELVKQGYRPVWLGGEDDRDLNQRLAVQCGIDATGLFSVLELAELGRHARFAVTNDSAPMHVLSCSSIPVYGLFGPTDWRRTHAVGQAAHVIVPDHDHDLAALPVDKVRARLIADGWLAA